MSEQAVSKIELAAAPAVHGENAALISMIERAARDPAVDIAKMERLFDMHERMQKSAAERAYWAAFSEMQPKLPTIERNGTIKTNEKVDGQKTGRQVAQSKYALWEDIDESARPIYTAHGFSLTFRMEQTPERLTTTAVLAHRDGHSERTSFSCGCDSSGSKNNVQGWGSAMSYGKRYTGTAILNIVTRGQDDDGRAAGSGFISEAQYKELADLIRATNTDLQAFLDLGGVESLADIPAAQFQAAKAKLVQKQRQGARRP